MILVRNFADKFAISLSLACAIHCVLTPWLLVMAPSLAGLNLDNEAFHVWMVIAVIPLSLYALGMGCNKHKNLTTAVLGGVGLTLLVVAVMLGENNMGEFGEKAMTVLGAGLIAVGHYRNFHLCRELDCACDDSRA